MSLVSVVVDIAVVGSVAVALLGVSRVMRRPAMGDGGARGRWAGPGAPLAVVVALCLLNQVLFTVYVLRVHGGDVSFVARHLPEGWFALAAENPAIDGLARRFPAPWLLAPTVLRVQAFLELPFVLLAYATMLRRLDHGLYRRLAGSYLIWVAAASYTVVFCVVEWDLRNPYTVDDIAIRLVAAVVTPAFVMWTARRDGGGEDDEPASLPGLVMFAASTWALGHLVLVVYDCALLYNLGHLGGRLPGAVIALAVLAVTRVAAGRLRGRGPSAGGAATIASGLRWSLALFFVPALAVRYGVTFATPALSAGAGLLVAVVAGGHAVRAGLAETRGGSTSGCLLVWAARHGAAACAGLVAAYAAARWVDDTYYEAALLRAAAVFLITAVLVCGLRWPGNALQAGYAQWVRRNRRSSSPAGSSRSTRRSAGTVSGVQDRHSS
jgi:hypothetical protein